MRTIYRHVQLKTRIVRRAMIEDPLHHHLDGTYLPGKNGRMLVNVRWPDSLW